MNNRHLKSISALLSLLALIGAISTPAHAVDDAYIDVHGGLGTQHKIALPVFVAERGGSAAAKMAEEIPRIVAWDLDFSGHFAVVDKYRYPTTFRGLPADVHDLDLGDWWEAQVRYLLHGTVNVQGDQMSVQWRLFDVVSRRQVVGMEYRADTSLVRGAAHRMSNKIIERLIGGKGIADSRICFVSTATGQRELYIADYDGQNLERLTNDGAEKLTPVWSPDRKMLAFTSYIDNNPDLYLIQVETRFQNRLAGYQNLNIAPSWSPDGKRLALTLSKDGNSEIYLIDVNGGNLKRLTRNAVTDTSPTFSPDGREIAFVSTRSGRPQIWIMNADGRGTARRVSFQGGNSYDPNWSPAGDKIAYVSERSGEGLEIYTVETNGRNAARLTDAIGANEAPSWSPDGKYLTFASSREGSWNIYLMRADGGGCRRITFMGGDATGPDWWP